MKFNLTNRLTLALALSAILLGVGSGIYYWIGKDSRAIAYHKARLQPSADNSNRKADQDALVKLGWLVRRNVHLSHQTIKTNAAKEFFRIARDMGVQLKEPVFFSIFRPDPETPADIIFTASREDVPTVERVLARLDAATEQ